VGKPQAFFHVVRKKGKWVQRFMETCENGNALYKIKNGVWTVPTSLKVNIWCDHLYSSTQPEPSLTSFPVICFGSLQE